MKNRQYFPLIGIALGLLVSGNIMALDFGTVVLPGTGGGGTQPTPANVLIFTCKNPSATTNTSGSTSCSTTGTSSSSCSSGSSPSSTQSSIVAWEMTNDNPTIREKLTTPGTTCSEAIEAAGVNNCTPSGGDLTTIYTCKIQ